MKAIKINAIVNLTSGLSIPAGSIAVIAEGYADVKSQKDGIIPAQVATFVFASLAAIQEGKTPIAEIADFNPVFAGLELTIANYATVPAETLLVDAVFNALESIYGEDVEVINL
jgi:hypothetical protein